MAARPTARYLCWRPKSRLPLRIVRLPGANISQGRNAAIQAATGEVIAVTDAGVWLGQQWLERITAPFEDEETQAVAGFFVPDPQTVFEMAMGATVLPDVGEVNPADFNSLQPLGRLSQERLGGCGRLPRVARLL